MYRKFAAQMGKWKCTAAMMPSCCLTNRRVHGTLQPHGWRGRCFAKVGTPNPQVLVTAGLSLTLQTSRIPVDAASTR
jgi:hypothetical protein